MRIGKCQDITVKNSTIGRINIFKEFNGGISFKNCEINRMKKSIFDNCDFEKTKVQKVFSNKSIKYFYIENKFAINCFSFLFAIFFLSFLLLFLFEWFADILMILLFPGLSIIGAISLILARKRISKVKEKKKEKKKSE